MNKSSKIYWVDLDDGVNTWAEKVLESMKYRERKNMSKIISSAGYSIMEESKKLKDIYIRLYNRCN